MKALCWHGKADVRIDDVPDPKIKDHRDAIVQVTATAICGSDLHLYDGYNIGLLDKIPFGALMNKGLTLKTGQTHVHRYLEPLLEKIEQGEIDPSFVITHRLKLDDAPGAYKTFREKEEGCIKVVMTP